MSRLNVSVRFVRSDEKSVLVTSESLVLLLLCNTRRVIITYYEIPGHSERNIIRSTITVLLLAKTGSNVKLHHLK